MIGYPPKDAYPPPGYPAQGYPPPGYGYPQQGYPPPQYAQQQPNQQVGFLEGWYDYDLLFFSLSLSLSLW